MIPTSALLTLAGAVSVVLGVVTGELGFLYAAIGAACASLLMLGAGVLRTLRRDPTGSAGTGTDPTGSGTGTIG